MVIDLVESGRIPLDIEKPNLLILVLSRLSSQLAGRAMQISYSKIE